MKNRGRIFVKKWKKLLDQYTIFKMQQFRHFLLRLFTLAGHKIYGFKLLQDSNLFSMSLKTVSIAKRKFKILMYPAWGKFSEVVLKI